MTDKNNQTNENRVKDEALKDVNGGVIIPLKTNALNDDALEGVSGGMMWNHNETGGKRR